MYRHAFIRFSVVWISVLYYSNNQFFSNSPHIKSLPFRITALASYSKNVHTITHIHRCKNTDRLHQSTCVISSVCSWLIPSRWTLVQAEAENICRIGPLSGNAVCLSNCLRWMRAAKSYGSMQLGWWNNQRRDVAEEQKKRRTIDHWWIAWQLSLRR